MDYFVTVREEVLREVASSVIAKITKYMIENNISTDHKNAISVMLDKVYDLSDSLIEHPDYGMDDLEKISAKLSFAKEYIDEMIECNG